MGKLHQTELFQHIPIVSNILVGAHLIYEIVEKPHKDEQKMLEIKLVIEQITPALKKLSEAKHSSTELEHNLQNISEIVEALYERVNEYHTSSSSSKLTFSLISNDLIKLKSALSTLDLTINALTYTTLLRTEAKIDALVIGQTASQNRASRTANMEVDANDIEWVEEEPFAFGTSGRIYRVKFNRQIVAAKVISLKDVEPKEIEKIKKAFKNELAIMGGLFSLFTARVLGGVTTLEELIILMEYCSEGDLRSKLNTMASGENIPFNFQQSVHLLLDVAHGMKYLHTRPTPVLHKDLKSLNILLDKNTTAKVSDFGRSEATSIMSCKQTRVGEVGTYAWCAPEILEGGESSKKADVYAFGIIIWEILTHAVPWLDVPIGNLVKRVCNGERPDVSSTAGADERLVQLMRECWEGNPIMRPNFGDIVLRLEELEIELETENGGVKTKKFRKTPKKLVSLKEKQNKLEFSNPQHGGGGPLPAPATQRVERPTASRLYMSGPNGIPPSESNFVSALKTGYPEYYWTQKRQP